MSLAPHEIRQRREQAGMSRSKFAQYLGVSASSIKRWEAGGARERYFDDLIRLRTEISVAQWNLANLIAIQRTPERAIYGEIPVSFSQRKQEVSDETVAFVHTMRSQGVSYQAIADQLNASGISTRNGAKWYRQSILRICNQRDRSGLA